jgi:hypothetical protein
MDGFGDARPEDGSGTGQVIRECDLNGLAARHKTSVAWEVSAAAAAGTASAAVSATAMSSRFTLALLACPHDPMGR